MAYIGFNLIESDILLHQISLSTQLQQGQLLTQVDIVT